MANRLKKIPAWILVVGVFVILALWMVSIYNGLVIKEGSVQSTWAEVEVQYQRRSDLVPQLVATVEGAADFEQSTLTEVTEARTNWLTASSDPNVSTEEQIAAATTFDSAFARLLVSVEAYPDLTATLNFQTLQSQLEGTENRVAVARMDFNNTATKFNITVRKIPTRFIASLFGFEAYPLFESKEDSQNAPSVEFNFGE